MKRLYEKVLGVLVLTMLLTFMPTIAVQAEETKIPNEVALSTILNQNVEEASVNTTTDSVISIQITIAVENNIESISLNDLKTKDPNAVLTFYGTNPDGTPLNTDQSVALAEGENTVVYAQIEAGDKSISSKYTITISRAENDDKNGNNIPDKVELKTILGEMFTIDSVQELGTIYMMEVSLSVDNHKDSVSAEDIISLDENAHIQFFGTVQFTDKEATEPVSLKEGEQTKVYGVVNEAGGKKGIYTITINRAENDDENGNNIPDKVELKSVLGKSFTIENVQELGTMYMIEVSLSVDNHKDSVSSDDMISLDENAHIQFFGTVQFTDKEATEPVSLKAGEQTKVYGVVNEADGNRKGIYTITISRAEGENDDKNGNNISDKVELKTILGEMFTIDSSTYDETNKLYQIEASLSVDSGTNSVALSDFVKLDENANAIFYGTDSSWGDEVQEVSLKPDGATTVYVKVVADNQAVSSKYAITISKSIPTVPITEFEAINLHGGTVENTVYPHANDVVSYLNDNYSDIVIAGTNDIFPVTSWISKDGYHGNAAGDYTFTAVLGAAPSGYSLAEGVTATAVVHIFNENDAAGVKDSDLNRRLCAALSVGEDHLITVADMMRLKGTLDLSDSNSDNYDEIQDYSGLRHAQNITVLNLAYNKMISNGTRDLVADISYLTKLESLNIDSAEIGSAFPELTGLSKLKELNISNNKLTILPNMRNMKVLETLGIEYNSPKDISQIEGLIKLQSLNMEGCELNTIPDLSALVSLVYLDVGKNKFTGFSSNDANKLPPSLKSLDISRCSLGNLNDLSSFKNLEYLNVRVNQLTSLSGIEALSSLTKLYAGGNELTSVPDLSQLTNLTELVLDSNKFTTLTVKDLPKLINLNVLDNDLNSITLEGLPALMELNLQGNDFTTLPDISSLTALTTIDASSNKLTDLTGDFSALTKVTEFDGKKNQITAVSDSICTLTSLNRLDLEDNNITSISDNISKLTALTILNLEKNSLTALPDTIQNMTSLEVMKLNQNQLSALPLELSGLTSLTGLELANNSFEAIPESIQHLKELKNLNLETNSLTTLPASMGELTKLENLYLKENKFSKFPSVIPKLIALEMLDLQQNRLIDIDVDSDGQEVDLSNLSNLTEVNLGNNRITALPECIKNLSNLSKLQINDNYITNIPEGYLSAMNQLDEFTVTYNFIDWDNDTVSHNEVKKFIADGHSAGNNYTGHYSFALLKALDTSVGSIDVQGGKANDYTHTMNAPAGTTSVTITPIGIRSETKISMGNTEINSGETLTVDGLTTGSNTITLVATNVIDDSTVNYEISLNVLEKDAEELDPDNLPDGNYIIDADALQENNNSLSMCNQFITETTKLKVEGGNITATIVWNSTEIKMSTLKGLWYQDKNGAYVALITPGENPTYSENVDYKSDSQNDSLTMTFPVKNITEATYMKVYAPDGMGESTPLFRLIFKTITLVKEGEPNPNSKPVKEVNSNGNLAEVTRDTISDIHNANDNVGFKFNAINVVIPTQYLKNYFSNDSTGTGSLQLQSEQSSNQTKQTVQQIITDKDSLISSIDLNLNLVNDTGSQSVTDLGGIIKVMLTLTDEQVSNLNNADSMKLCYYNPTTGKLEDLGAAAIFNLDAKTVTFYTNHLSTYVIVSTKNESSGGGENNNGNNNPGEQPNNNGLSNGTYRITVDALMESSSQNSMADQFFVEPAQLSVSGETINVTVAMYGTSSSPEKSDGISMDYIDKIEYKNSSGSWQNIKGSVNTSEDSMRINFTVYSLSNPVYIRVLVPKVMGPSYKVFRLVFNQGSLSSGSVNFGSWKQGSQDNDETKSAQQQAFTIKVKAEEGGTISPKANTKVVKGKDATFTITANKGYTIKDVLVDGKSLGEISTYTFKNVQTHHTINAIFMKTKMAKEELTFNDIAGHWAEEYIKTVVEEGIFTGIDNGKFAPNDVVTRGMLATVLGRLYGADLEKYSTSSFSDVPKNKYYSSYIAWAADNGIVHGVGDNEFAPDRPISRESAAVMFVRYAEYAGLNLVKEEKTESKSKGLADGSYQINAKALMESKDSVSMCNQFITEPATLNVKAGRMTVHMNWKGTQYMTMDMVEELKYLKSNGDFVEVDKVLDEESNTLTIQFEVENLKDATIMQVYVPKGMPGMRPKFRLVFDESSMTTMTLAVSENSFTDGDKISTWAKVSVEKINQAGLIKGKENNMFDPQGTATRSEIAKILSLLMNWGEN